MSSNPAEDEENALAALSRRLTGPGERECLRCYLLRMISEFGCDGTHRWTIRWRDLMAPRAAGLVRRLQNRGGICCDCEVIFNVFTGSPDDQGPCAGIVRAGSSLPCDRRTLRKTA